MGADSGEVTLDPVQHRQQEWFGLLDAWRAPARSHTEIARWLAEIHGLSSPAAQALAVDYERSRGLRPANQRPEGWTVTASKTVEATVARAYGAFTDAEIREQWLPGARMQLRTGTVPTSARFDWGDGPGRLAVGFVAAGESRCRVSLGHDRLPDADAATAMKAWWRDHLEALKSLLET